MRTIWKYPFELVDKFSLEMPRDAEILSIQIQHDQITMWAFVDPQGKKETRTFRVYGTGHTIEKNDPGQFIGTVQMANGNLVWHVFETTWVHGESI